MFQSRVVYIPFGVGKGVHLRINKHGDLWMDFLDCSTIPCAYVPQVARQMRILWDDWNAARNKLTKEVA